MSRQTMATHSAAVAPAGVTVGLRNLVARGYSGIDPTLVHAASTDGVRDLDAFATELARWLESRA